MRAAARLTVAAPGTLWQPPMQVRRVRERAMDFDAAREAMVEGQVRPSDVTRADIIEAMREIPREPFAPRALRSLAYADIALELAPGRRMLEPRTFAKLLSAAELRPGDLVLDVGCASGYSAAVIARLAAYVVAVEENEALAAQAEARFEAMEVANVALERRPLASGAPEAGPYEAIIVEGGVEIEPTALLSQLKPGGRLVAIRVDGPNGRAMIWRRGGDRVSSAWVFDAPAEVLPGFDAAPAFTF
jgi:protein-L-isoaspartate(D-aspartate) O-methyltransferase